MADKRHNPRKFVEWHPVASERDGSVDVISLHNLERTHYRVTVVDRSVIGIGIESDLLIPTGVIWFSESVYGQKCGVLMWCKQIGARYRSGIHFVSLTRAEEEYLRHQVEQVEPNNPIRDPDRIIATLIGCIKKS